MNTLKKSEILKYFFYDKEKGILIWKYHWNKSKLILIGEVAGTKNKEYCEVVLNSRRYCIHRLIWFLEKNNWPEMIDHIDGDKHNNKIKNLRAVSNRINQHNRWTHRSKLKLVGAFWDKSKNRWKSALQIKNRHKHLGLFDTEIEAHERYMQELKTRGLI